MGRDRTVDLNLRHVRDSVTGEREWEFPCECGHRSCDESVYLTLDAFSALRERDEPVLAAAHHVSQVARARRLGEAAKALRAQAEHQLRRARRNLRDL